MQDAYAATVLAETPVVLGKRLVPFSLGHAHILEAIGSPIMQGGDVSLSDLVIAVVICHRPAFGPDRFTIVLGDKLERECKRWGRQQASANFADELDAFRDYIRSHTNAPRRWNKGESAMRIPWTLALFHSITSGRINEASERFAWNMPLPFAIAYNAAKMAAAGDDSLVSDEEINAAEKLRELEKQNGASCNTRKD